MVVHSFRTYSFIVRLLLVMSALCCCSYVYPSLWDELLLSYLVGLIKNYLIFVHLSHVSALFYFLQVVVTLFLALVVGAIFFGVKEDQTGIQNRLFLLAIWRKLTYCSYIFMSVSNTLVFLQFYQLN